MGRGLILLLLLCGCTDLGTNPLPRVPLAAVQFVPDAQYREWWGEIEACCGVRCDFDKVRWYVADEILYTPAYGPQRHASGLYDAGTNSICILRSSVGEAGIVRHEMWHAINRNVNHPDTPCEALFSGSSWN